MRSVKIVLYAAVVINLKKKKSFPQSYQLKMKAFFRLTEPPKTDLSLMQTLFVGTDPPFVFSENSRPRSTIYLQVLEFELSLVILLILLTSIISAFSYLLSKLSSYISLSCSSFCICGHSYCHFLNFADILLEIRASEVHSFQAVGEL